MEQKLPHPFREGYNYDVEHIRLDIYRLLNQYLAQEKMIGLMNSDPHFYNAVDSIGQYFDVETQRILISAATISRVIDDNEEEQYRLHNYDTVCGELIPDLSQPNIKEGLTLREACNKIMHAQIYRYDIDEDEIFITPKIYLYGKKNRKEWKATFSIIDFSKEYLANVV